MHALIDQIYQSQQIGNDEESNISMGKSVFMQILAMKHVTCTIPEIHSLDKLSFERTAAAWSPPNKKYGCLSAAAADNRPRLRKPLSEISFVAKSHPLPESRSRIGKSGFKRVNSLHFFKSYPTVFISELKFFKPAADLKVGIAICKSVIPAEYISNRSGLLSCNNIKHTTPMLRKRHIHVFCQTIGIHMH